MSNHPIALVFIVINFSMVALLAVWLFLEGALVPAILLAVVLAVSVVSVMWDLYEA